MTYEPPPIAYVGSSLHESVVSAMRARGDDEHDREVYLTEAARQFGSDYVDPMSRPLRDPTPWQVRRARDNAIGQVAADLLEKEGKRTHTADEYHDAIARVEQQVGHRIRDDVPRLTHDPKEHR
jgi:hypothetical protein